MLYDTRWDIKVDPVTEVITGAANYIEAHGWKQAYGKHGGARCVMGALKSMTDDIFIRMEARERIGATIGSPFVETWNDTRGRTKGEVVAALRAAAQL
jgi:hypothetical protein